MNGTDVLLYVDNGFGTLVVVGSQRNVDFKEATAAIDVSSKISRNRRIIAGRYSSDVTLSHLYVPTASGYGRLRDAMRAGTAITVGRYQGGSKLEQSSAIVTSLDGNFPDQGAAVISIGLAVDGAWQ
jgi:hypothetical protein